MRQTRTSKASVEHSKLIRKGELRSDTRLLKLGTSDGREQSGKHSEQHVDLKEGRQDNNTGGTNQGRTGKTGGEKRSVKKTIHK